MLTRKNHTIVLVQFGNTVQSRSYLDYESLGEAFDGICQLYEQGLKGVNPQIRNVTYDLNQLFEYLDNMYDLSLLEYHPQLNAYLPHGKDWIKKQLFNHIKAQAMVEQ
eukprot:GHVR01001012.1.p1 GENE.GHVR01001012.1~~GHVR01001012.1.p1  ORF type:complete len:108 (+),score=11.92 GHVR01001012.1:17-340(+)